MCILATTNRKGGVGKTMASSGMLRELNRRGHKVLAVDSDPQQTMIQDFGTFEIPDEVPMWLYMTGDEPDFPIYPTEIPGLDALVGNADLIDDTLRGESEFNSRDEFKDAMVLHVKDVLARKLETYDFIILDCPPSITALGGILTRAADFAVVPTRPKHSDWTVTQIMTGGLDEFNIPYVVILNEFKRGNRPVQQKKVRQVYGAYPDRAYTFDDRDRVEVCKEEGLPLTCVSKEFRDTFEKICTRIENFKLNPELERQGLKLSDQRLAQASNESASPLSEGHLEPTATQSPVPDTEAYTEEDTYNGQS